MDVNAGDPVADTNGEPVVAHGVAKQLQDSPFADANPPMKEGFARALIASEIGDYDRALVELEDLRSAGGLDSAQAQAVKELLRRVKAAAPASTTSNASTTEGSNPPPETFPLAAEGDQPFSTANRPVSESFARAKTAYDIGNYPVALVELQELATNAHLNVQQRYLVQTLLDKTPRPLPGVQR